jgi:hypothetical protein
MSFTGRAGIFRFFLTRVPREKNRDLGVLPVKQQEEVTGS